MLRKFSRLLEHLEGFVRPAGVSQRLGPSSGSLYRFAPVRPVPEEVNGNTKCFISLIDIAVECMRKPKCEKDTSVRTFARQLERLIRQDKRYLRVTEEGRPLRLLSTNRSKVTCVTTKFE